MMIAIKRMRHMRLQRRPIVRIRHQLHHLIINTKQRIMRPRIKSCKPKLRPYLKAHNGITRRGRRRRQRRRELGPRLISKEFHSPLPRVNWDLLNRRTIVIINEPGLDITRVIGSRDKEVVSTSSPCSIAKFVKSVVLVRRPTK